MGPLAGLDYALLAVFGVAAFLASAGAVLVSGFLPRDEGPRAARGPLGAILVYGTLVAVVLLALVVLATALALPWAVAVVIGGLAFLAAPFAVDPLPERARESRVSLLTVIATSATAAALLPMPWFP